MTISGREKKRVWDTRDKGINLAKTDAWTTFNTWSSLEGKFDVI